MMAAPLVGESREREMNTPIPMARLAGRPLLLLLDVDGTLAPIAPHPSLTRVPDDTRRLIASLVTHRQVFVVLVSGRAAHDARRVVGVERVWTVGNHGAEVMDPDGEVTVDSSVSQYAEAIAEAARTLAPLLGPISGVMLENKTWTLSVHYRGADGAVEPRLRGIVEGVAAQHGLRVMEGKKILEIRPPVRVDKGTAIARLARHLGATGDAASLLFAGDDVTDEDAFRVLRNQFPHAVTIHIGSDPTTAAEFTFDDLAELRDVLQRIARASSTER